MYSKIAPWPPRPDWDRKRCLHCSVVAQALQLAVAYTMRQDNLPAFDISEESETYTTTISIPGDYITNAGSRLQTVRFAGVSPPALARNIHRLTESSKLSTAPRRSTCALRSTSPPLKSRKKRKIWNANIRRPQLPGYWYSISQDAFDNLDENRRRVHAHIGRIEELDGVGVESLTPCTECTKKGYSCKVYTDVARKEYSPTG